MNFNTAAEQASGKRRSMAQVLASPSNTLEKHSNKRQKVTSSTTARSIQPFKSEEVDTEEHSATGSADYLDFSHPSSRPPVVVRTPEKLENLSPFGGTPLVSKRSPKVASAKKRLYSATKAENSNQYSIEEMESILAQTRGKSCIINDPVHGQIIMDGLCLRIIDTKEFQRLRYLKQLGTCDYVYPGATHSRFSHSIGVAYYSELLLKNLKNNQPYLSITPIDILCVKIAGLCHDLGHGAYSHVWEVFMQSVSTEKWHHEESSVQMFKLLIQRNKINLSDYGLSSQDELFITEIIQGKKEAERCGRGKDKFFLYDIVNNSRSGLDVDKLDYFLRDIKHTNVNLNSVSFDRFFQLGRVLKAEPIQGGASKEFMYTICYPEKMVGEAVNLFAMRFHLHQKVYTHKSVKKVEYMLVDAFAKADPYIKIPGTVTDKHPDGLYRLSECVFDTVALSNLNDSIIYLIETNVAPELQPAKEILEKVRTRQFYDCLGKAMYKRGSKLDEMKTTEIGQRIVDLANIYLNELRVKSRSDDHVQSDSEGLNRGLSINSTFNQDYGFINPNFEQIDENYILSQDSFQPWLVSSLLNHGSQQSQRPAVNPVDNIKEVELDDIIVEKMLIHYGLKGENPVNRLRFFPKDSEDVISSRWDENIIGGQIKEQQYETLLPRVFEETAVRLFCRANEKSPYVAEAFKRFSKAMNGADPFPLLSQSQY